MALVTYVHLNSRVSVILGKNERITFNGGAYSTSDEDEQKRIEAHGLFGKKFKRLETARDYARLRGHRARSTVYAEGPQTTVEKGPEVNVGITVEDVAPSDPKPSLSPPPAPQPTTAKRSPGRPRRIV